MTRSVGTVISNNLARGLITEATGLNFPDNAVTEALNVVFEHKGSVRRRKGIDVEGGATTLTYSDDDGLIQEFIWNAVARTGGFTFLVLQIGSFVHFFELTQEASLSAGIAPVSLDLNDYKAPGAQELNFVPCAFAAGSGYLFIAHPYTDPIIVRWNEDGEYFEASKIDVLIRDFEGVPDSLSIAENPTTLSSAHHYNLKNQGWNQQVRVGSVNNEAGVGGSFGGTTVSPTLDWTQIS